ncbi:hypothetical protein [Streptomyces sp. NPDC051183]|uniref:hypothetical protein n=1 Tax=unclassified Streptomyces TaxID=2593676 RepID=UPI003426E755
MTAAFVVASALAERKSAPRGRGPQPAPSAPVAVAAVLGVTLGALATDRTLHLGLDELKTLMVPLTTGHATDALLRTRTRAPRKTFRPWVDGKAAAAFALLVGTLVSGATTYF